MPDLEWMAWTTPTAFFVAGVIGFLVGLTVVAVLRPSTPRKGFLPMPTARGDRVYVSLLGTGLISIIVLASTSLPLTAGLVVAAVWVVVVMRWG